MILLVHFVDTTACYASKFTNFWVNVEVDSAVATVHTVTAYVDNQCNGSTYS